MTTLNDFFSFEWLKSLITYWVKVFVVFTSVTIIVIAAFLMGPGKKCPEKCPHCGRQIEAR